ncbi:hypothetical protein RO3G_16388 [Rhizopus delemar RA 99-880]|uniref:Uncharacterized protein n=1 Tax=Rhizopus delemar (strain RA 99-880 / ATCC MYA-4621 / FGSC 9543 / NRRL 43880) TaxID=246409 RepID=I1CT97_RHIO9|nr:hypothetical protein RO3G_16388 [Rhizopus delemar RA 99-880]|eukprot:EIE91677.1 hypothetical protein RO3G_16388 [Rhizopus delemar RA 99-880]
MPNTSPQPLTSNIMKRKRSIRNESGDDPRIHSSTLLTTEEDSILVSTQEVLKALLTTTAESQDDIPIDQQHSTTMFNIDGALTQSSSYCVSGLVSVAFHSILFFDIDRKNLPENVDSFSLL